MGFWSTLAGVGKQFKTLPGNLGRAAIGGIDGSNVPFNRAIEVMEGRTPPFMPSSPNTDKPIARFAAPDLTNALPRYNAPMADTPLSAPDSPSAPGRDDAPLKASQKRSWKTAMRGAALGARFGGGNPGLGALGGMIGALINPGATTTAWDEAVTQPREDRQALREYEAQRRQQALAYEQARTRSQDEQAELHKTQRMRGNWQGASGTNGERIINTYNGEVRPSGYTAPPPRPVSVAPGGTLVDPQTGKPIFTAPAAPQRPMSVAPGGTVIDPQTGKPLFTAPDRPQRPMSVAPGGTVIDPKTGKPIYRAPDRVTKKDQPRYVTDEEVQAFADEYGLSFEAAAAEFLQDGNKLVPRRKPQDQ